MQIIKNVKYLYHLHFHAMKTQSMLISTKQKNTMLKTCNLKTALKIRDHELEVVDKTKYPCLSCLQKPWINYMQELKTLVFDIAVLSRAAVM